MKLNDQQIQDQLSQLDGWSREDNQITKQYSCKNFLDAVSFVDRIAPAAENMDHHPDISIKNYNKVTIVLSTHSEGGITDKDFRLAEKIEQVFQK